MVMEVFYILFILIFQILQISKTLTSVIKRPASIPLTNRQSFATGDERGFAVTSVVTLTYVLRTPYHNLFVVAEQMPSTTQP